MLTLYHAPRSRSSRVIWLLEELGADYEVVYCDISRRDGSGAPDPRNPHPDKKVPALVHDGTLMTESVAIMLYLTDLFTEAGLGRQIGDPERGAYLTWLAYYAGEIEPAFVAKFKDETETDPQARKAYDAVIRRLLSAVEPGPYLMGERFSAADVLIGSPLQWFRQFAPESRALDVWIERISARPAHQRAVAKDDAAQAASQRV